MVGQGEVKVKVYFGNEVMWEPGCDFDDSPGGRSSARNPRIR
jgi:hypothetical protein